MNATAVTTTVIALGGNALLRRGEPMDPVVQDRNIEVAARAILVATSGADRVAITHGNGPQVGLLAVADASRPDDLRFTLDVLDAESEGMIGYLLARHLNRPGGRPVTAVLTQVVVDRDDPAFQAPTKPIGPVLDRATALQLADERGWRVAPDGGGGAGAWRRVVASPAPRSIVELESIRLLLDAGNLVVCAGGGGVPVVLEDHRLAGIEAVVDKDATSSLLAQLLDADRLVLLTDVDAVLEGWGTPDARPIAATTSDALRAGNFATGSMGPKVRAACDFVDRTGGEAVIGSLDHLAEVLGGTSGTQIRPTSPGPDRGRHRAG